MDYKLPDRLRRAVDSAPSFETFLAEVVRQDSRANLLEDMPHLSNLHEFEARPDWPIVQAGAREFNLMERELQLLAIDELMDMRNNRARANGVWINRQVALQLANFAKPGERIRCAFEASLHSALLLASQTVRQDTKVMFVAQNEQYVRLAQLLALALDLEFACEIADPLARSQPLIYDFEISCPPLGRSMSEEVAPKTAKALGLSAPSARVTTEIAALADLKEHAVGKALLVVSEGTLFRMVGAERVARSELVDSGRVKAVFAIPARMMSNRYSLELNAVILDGVRSHHEFIRFVDLASDEFSNRGPRGSLTPRGSIFWADIVDGHFDKNRRDLQDVSVSLVLHEHGGALNVSRYLAQYVQQVLDELTNRHESVELGEIAEIIRPSAAQKSDDGEFTFLEASPSDIPDRGFVEKPKKLVTAASAGRWKIQDQVLRPLDILLSFKGTIGTVGIAPPQVNTNDPGNGLWSAGQSLLILRPNPAAISPFALYELLRSDAVQELLQSLAGGATVPSLNMKDIRSLRVPLPSHDEQQDIEHNFWERQALFDKIERLRREIFELQQKCWPHLQLTKLANEHAG